MEQGSRVKLLYEDSLHFGHLSSLCTARALVGPAEAFLIWPQMKPSSVLCHGHRGAWKLCWGWGEGLRGTEENVSGEVTGKWKKRERDGINRITMSFLFTENSGSLCLVEM